MCFQDDKVLIEFQGIRLGGRDADPITSPGGDTFLAPAAIVVVSYMGQVDSRGAEQCPL